MPMITFMEHKVKNMHDPDSKAKIISPRVERNGEPRSQDRKPPEDSPKAPETDPRPQPGGQSDAGEQQDATSNEAETLIDWGKTVSKLPNKGAVFDYVLKHTGVKIDPTLRRDAMNEAAVEALEASGR